MSLGVAEAAEMIEAMYRAALRASDPRMAVRDALTIDDRGVSIAGQHIDLSGRLVVIAVGKAAVTMAQGAVDALGDRIDGGIAITKDRHSGDVALPRFSIYEAGHPIPDERGVTATRRAIELAASCGPDDLLLALISGGGSALFEAPKPPVSLADLAAMTDLLLRAGAPIEDLNAARTPLSQVKGGGLLRAAGSATVATLILSDVLGNDPAVIASGPTVPGVASNAGSRAVLERYGLWEQVSESIRVVLDAPDPTGSTDNPGIIEIVADNQQAVDSANETARELGLRSEIVWREMTGEASDRARLWADACEAAGDETDCLLGGGELTVTVHGDGIGGRNTEFVLAAAIELDRRGMADWVVASLATDGQDGPTNVAGGIADRTLVEKSLRAGIDPAQALEQNDSLSALKAGGQLVEPGPTGTNVNDLYFAVRVQPD
jgi:hydroxypyruvate reductase